MRQCTRRSVGRAVVALVAGVAMTAGLPMVAPVPAAATGSVGHTQLVPDLPRTDTPRVTSGNVEDMVQWGNRVVLVGSFTSLSDADGTSFAQPYIAAYDIDTGLLVRSFRPTFDRGIVAAAVSADGQDLFVVGQFNTVNGVSRRKVAKLNWDGTLDTTFRANANARASAVAVAADGSAVYVGGFFSRIRRVDRGLLAALNPTTGAVDAAFDLPITEGLGPNATLKVQSLLLTPDDDTLVVIHTGARVDGQLREGIALIDTNTKQLLPWQTDIYTENLPRVGGVLRITEGDISPDGSYFVVVSGSGGDRPPINDTAIAWPVDGGPGIEPLWVSRHFDSLFTVAITEYAVYIGGHFRWQESPTSTDPWPGDDFTNYGWDSGIGAYALGDEVVRRDQIGALDPLTGKAMNWSPGSNALVGVSALEAVPRGLLVAHDGTTLGGLNVGRHGFFDWESVPAQVGPQTTIVDPFSGLTVTSSPFEFTGTASADAGVSRVQLEIQNTGSGVYLQDDLATLSSSWNGINAELDVPGATETGWRLAASLPSGSYRVLARAFGQDGSRDSTKARVSFEVNVNADQPPTTAITYPTWGTTPSSNTFIMTGTAADDLGVDSIRIVVRNLDTDEYLQDDYSVGLNYNAFSVPVDPPGGQVVNWEFEVTVPNGTWRLAANAIDTSGQRDNGFHVAQVTIDPTNAAPSVTVTSPAPFSTFTANTSILLSGTAADDVAVNRVELRIVNLQTTMGVMANGTYGIPGWVDATLTGSAGTPSWTFTTPSLPPGVYSITARATDDKGVRTPSASQARLTITGAVPGDAAPDTTFAQAGYNQDIDAFTVNISGTATDDNGVVRVAVTIQETFAKNFLQGRRYVTAAGTFDPAYTEMDAVLSGSSTSRTWTLSGITIPEEGDYTITVKAVDTAGQYDIDQTGASARWLIWPGDTDPYTWIQGPDHGDVLPAGSVIINGRAFDDLAPCSPGFTCGIQRVDLRIRDGSGLYLTSTGAWTTTETWIQAYLTNPGGQFSNWSYATPSLPAGTYTLRARATDLRRQTDQVVNPYPAAPGQEPDQITITLT